MWQNKSKNLPIRSNTSELKKHRTRSSNMNSGSNGGGSLNGITHTRTPTMLDGFFSENKKNALDSGGISGSSITPTTPSVTTNGTGANNQRLLHYSRGIASHSGRW